MAFTTINKGSSYFNTVLYTGAGTTQSITGVGFKPDFVWLKARSYATGSNLLQDIVRGSTKTLFSNATNAETTFVNGLTSFNSDGFSIGTQGGGFNENTYTYVSWNWLGANTTVSNTQGTITSTVSVNQTSGFSVGTYTGNGTGGATIGHGLGSVPKWIIVKERSGTNQWLVYHVSNGATKYMILETTGAVGTASTIWNDTTPTTNLFTVGSSSSVNGSGLTYVFYAFSEIKGYSKIGSYVGNGSTDGTFVYTGFKPAFVIRKDSSNVSDWRIDDSKRDGYNFIPFTLFPNYDSAETTSSGYYVDLLSNGFKCRGVSANQNTSSGTYIYMAFAENPFVLTDGTPVTAR